jgi:hypothetical protein
VKKTIITLALLAMSSISIADCANKDSTQVVFGKKISVQIPSGFVKGFHVEDGGRYMSEYVPKGESVEKWNQMFTLNVARDVANQPGATPESLINGIAAGFKSVCPTSFSITHLADKLPGVESKVAFLRCGNGNPAGSPAYSESVVIAAIKGKRDVVTVQWAERSAPSFSPVLMDKAKWQSRIDAIKKTEICAE